MNSQLKIYFKSSSRTPGKSLFENKKSLYIIEKLTMQDRNLRISETVEPISHNLIEKKL
jgi:hypothetical protein